MKALEPIPEDILREWKRPLSEWTEAEWADHQRRWLEFLNRQIARLQDTQEPTA